MAGEASLHTAPRGSGASNRYTFHRGLPDVGCPHDEREKNTLELSHAYVTAALDAFTPVMTHFSVTYRIALWRCVPLYQSTNLVPQRCQGEVGKG